MIGWFLSLSFLSHSTQPAVRKLRHHRDLAYPTSDCLSLAYPVRLALYGTPRTSRLVSLNNFISIMLMIITWYTIIYGAYHNHKHPS
jgi:hypothetical protein